MANYIKKIDLDGSSYELLTKFIQDTGGNAKTWEDIVALIDAGVQLVVDTPKGDGDLTPATTASISTMGKIYLVKGADSVSGTYTEWITIDAGEMSASRYSWEKIGTTATDLIDYAKKGSKKSDTQGEHSHSVNVNVNVPTVSSTEKHISASASGTKISVDQTANAVTGFNDPTTDSVLGAGTTFNVTGGDVSTTNIKATASGAAVGVDGTADAITALGKATTAACVTGYAAPETANAVTGYNSTTNDSVMGADTTFAVSGGDVTTSNIKATASGTAVSTTTADCVKSYPGATTKLATASITGTNGTESVLTSVSVTPGKAASLTGSIDGTTLVLNFTPNTPTAVSAGSKVTVAKAASAATTVVTGLSASGNGGTVMTGLGTPVTESVLKTASISSQPTVNLSVADSAGAGTVAVATGVGKFTVTSNKDDNVTALTGLGNPTTAAAITGLGTPTTSNAITGFGAHTTTAVATGVKVTAQPTIKLETAAEAAIGTVAVATGVTGFSVTANSDDRVDAITAINPTTTAVATSVKVDKDPTISLDGEAIEGITYISTIIIGSKSVAATGTAQNAGAHSHTTTI